MSGELRAGRDRLEEIKTAAAGEVDVTRDDTLQVAEAGESWVTAMLKRHGLDPDEAMELAQELGDGTVPNLAFMVGERRLAPRAALVAAIGAGYFNGLGVGLEARVKALELAGRLASTAEELTGQLKGKVVVALDRQVAEDALIGVLEQGERGGRRGHAQKAIRAAIRDQLEGPE